jgi:hypothetical protein
MGQSASVVMIGLGVGALFPLRSAPQRPRPAFAHKIWKLNTESPEGGGGFKSSMQLVRNRLATPRVFPRNSENFFSQGLGVEGRGRGDER